MEGERTTGTTRQNTGDDSHRFERKTELVGGQGQGKVQLTRRCATRLPRGFSPDPENQGYAREGQEQSRYQDLGFPRESFGWEPSGFSRSDFLREPRTPGSRSQVDITRVYPPPCRAGDKNPDRNPPPITAGQRPNGDCVVSKRSVGHRYSRTRYRRSAPLLIRFLTAWVCTVSTGETGASSEGRPGTKGGTATSR